MRTTQESLDVQPSIIGSSFPSESIATFSGSVFPLASLGHFHVCRWCTGNAQGCKSVPPAAGHNRRSTGSVSNAVGDLPIDQIVGRLRNPLAPRHQINSISPYSTGWSSCSFWLPCSPHGRRHQRRPRSFSACLSSSLLQLRKPS
jgi:hypothetical protein